MGMRPEMETAENRLKRLSMRSWRRGTKEMDLVLGPYADAHLAGMAAGELDLYEKLLEESDPELMAMILGQREPPAELVGLVARIGVFARARLGG